MDHKELLAVFGSRLRELRAGRGWTQGEVASRARVTRDFIGKAERGEREPSLFVVLKLATVFGVAPALLISPHGERRVLSELVALLETRTDAELEWLRGLIAYQQSHPGPAVKVPAPRLPQKRRRAKTQKPPGKVAH